MFRQIFLGVWLTLASSLVLGAGLDECNTSADSWQLLSATELRNVARSCQDSNTSKLFEMRAEYRRILDSSRILARMQGMGRGLNGGSPEAARIYMALVEALAPIWYTDETERVVFLAEEYGRRIRVADLRLRGYDNAAARLERDFASTY